MDGGAGADDLEPRNASPQKDGQSVPSSSKPLIGSYKQGEFATKLLSYLLYVFIIVPLLFYLFSVIGLAIAFVLFFFVVSPLINSKYKEHAPGKSGVMSNIQVIFGVAFVVILIILAAALGFGIFYHAFSTTFPVSSANTSAPTSVGEWLASNGTHYYGTLASLMDSHVGSFNTIEITYVNTQISNASWIPNNITSIGTLTYAKYYDNVSINYSASNAAYAANDSVWVYLDGGSKTYHCYYLDPFACVAEPSLPGLYSLNFTANIAGFGGSDSSGMSLQVFGAHDHDGYNCTLVYGEQSQLYLAGSSTPSAYVRNSTDGNVYTFSACISDSYDIPVNLTITDTSVTIGQSNLTVTYILTLESMTTNVSNYMVTQLPAPILNTS